MKLKYIVFIWCVFLRFNALVEGVRCFLCDSTENECPEFYPLRSRLQWKTCPEERTNVRMFGTCLKKIVHRASKVIVTRSCGYDYDWNTKAHCDTDDKNNSTTRCRCWDDLCNAATPSNVPRALLGLSVLGSVFIAYALN